MDSKLCRLRQLVSQAYQKGVKRIKKKKSVRKKSLKKREALPKEQGSAQIYDRVFKRLFSLSNQAVVSLLNGLFLQNFPMDSKVVCHNREFVRPDLGRRLADAMLGVDGRGYFHLEAQMRAEKNIPLRMFEYGFLYAIAMQDGGDKVCFPQSAVLYLNRSTGIPKESTLHVSFGGQEEAEYRVRNFLCLAYSAAELGEMGMFVLSPFQILRLRRLLERCLKMEKEGKSPDITGLWKLQEEVWCDIMGCIRRGLVQGSLTEDDVSQLLELTDVLHEHLCREYRKRGGKAEMKPLLPGALELPNDKYRIQIDKLEQKLSRYMDENARYADENAKYADENAKYADEIERYIDEKARYMDENAKLRQRIRELESRIQPSNMPS